MKAGLFAASIGLTMMMTQSVTAAEVTAFVTGAARRAYETLAPQFERATGHKLVAQFELPPTLVRKIDAGEPFDVIILSYDIEPLIKQGKLVAGSRAVFGRVGVGVAVQKGRAEAGLQHGRGLQALAAQRQAHCDVRGRQQRALRRLATRPHGNCRPGHAENPVGAGRHLGATGLERRGGLRGVGTAAADRDPKHRLARLSAGRDQQLAAVQRWCQRQSQRTGSRTRVAELPHDASAMAVFKENGLEAP